MKPCIVCGAECASAAVDCSACGCADFGPCIEPEPVASAPPAPESADAPPSEPAEPDQPTGPADRSVAESAPPAPVSNEPAKRRR